MTKKTKAPPKAKKQKQVAILEVSTTDPEALEEALNDAVAEPTKKRKPYELAVCSKNPEVR